MQGIICDETGRWLGGLCELWGVKSGLELVWELGFSKVILEVDLEVIAKAIALGCVNLGWHHGILSGIHVLMWRNWTVWLNHSFCKGNICADWLANAAVGLCKIEVCPELLRHLVIAILLGSLCPDSALTFHILLLGSCPVFSLKKKMKAIILNSRSC